VKSWRCEPLEIRKQRNRETSLLGGPSVEVNQDENACSKRMFSIVLWRSVHNVVNNYSSFLVGWQKIA